MSPDRAAAGIRQRHIAALARRAALHQGAARQLLDQRLQSLQADAAAEAAAPATPRANVPRPAPMRSALAELLADLTPAGDELHTPGSPVIGPQQPQGPRELKAVRDYRSTWSRLSVEQRVNQALARVPHNAGPLNTQRLVHQALTALRDASPAYLHRLVTQVEALLWLERVGQGESQPAATAKKKPDKAGAGGAPTGSARS